AGAPRGRDGGGRRWRRLRSAGAGRHDAHRRHQARSQRRREAGQAGFRGAGPGHVRHAGSAGGGGAEVHRRMNIALIGYGEVGRILAEELRAAGEAVTAYDLKFTSECGGAMRAHAAEHGVTLAESHAAAVARAELVICAVTASQTVVAAAACAPALP